MWNRNKTFFRENITLFKFSLMNSFLIQVQNDVFNVRAYETDQHINQWGKIFLNLNDHVVFNQEEDELDALKSAKELEEEKKKDKERQAKLVRKYKRKLFFWSNFVGWHSSSNLHDCYLVHYLCCCVYKGKNSFNKNKYFTK